MADPLSALVPQITIKAGNEQKNLLELGHRAADALARSTDANQRIREAFEQALLGDHASSRWKSGGGRLRACGFLRMSSFPVDTD